MLAPFCLPEILHALKTMGTLDVRTKPNVVGGASEFRVSGMDLQHLRPGAGGNITLTIPMSSLTAAGQ